jgi:hypothetical protein
MSLRQSINAAGLWYLRMWLWTVLIISVFAVVALGIESAGYVKAYFTPEDVGSKYRRECIAIWQAMYEGNVPPAWLPHCIRRRSGTL